MIKLQDFKYALTLLSKKPGFTVLTTLIMAVGIGLSVYQFSLLNTMVFKDLSFTDGDSIIVINSKRDGFIGGSWLKLHDLEELRHKTQGLSEFIAYKDRNINISGRDNAKQYTGIFAEPGIFQITRTQPLLGRGFTEAENREGAEEVIVLGYDLWQNLTGGDPDIINQSIRVNGKATRIIGVMPKGYEFPFTSDAWLPLKQNANEIPRNESPSVGGLAHFDKGTTIDSINQQFKTIMDEIAVQYPDSNSGLSADARKIPMMSFTNGGEAFIFALYVVAALLLILASINVGNLLLARAVERSKETAIRVALGAPRIRIVSQMLSESIIICCTGGVIGLLVVAWMLEGTNIAIAKMNGGRAFYWMNFGLDSFTIAIFFVFLTATILITGFLPAWKNSGENFNAVLRDGTRGALGKKAGRLNKILVTSEVFLSVAVLIIASVIVTGTYKAVHAKYGVTTAHKLTARIQLPAQRPLATIPEFVQNLMVSLEQNSNIAHPTITSALPGQYTWAALIAVDGMEYSHENALSKANYVAVMPGFFKSLDIKVIEGRGFDSSDNGMDKATVVVTKSFVDKYFPGQSALGQRVRIAETDGDTPKWLTIVGVVEHTTYAIGGFPGSDVGTIFHPFTQAPRHDLIVSVGMLTTEKNTIKILQDTLAAIDPDLALFDIIAYQKSIDRSSSGLIFISNIFIIFAVVSLGLAATGIYGVMSNTIIQRTQETGVKRALGACEATITKAFLWQGFKQLLWGAIPGIIIGTGVGFAITKQMSIDNSFLGLLCLSVTVCIGSIVLFATYLPTKQALNMEPSQALRHE